MAPVVLELVCNMDGPSLVYTLSLTFPWKRWGQSLPPEMSQNIVWGHFTQKESEHQKTTLASGDAPSTGHLFETTNPLLRVATGVFLLHIHFHILDMCCILWWKGLWMHQWLCKTLVISLSPCDKLECGGCEVVCALCLPFITSCLLPGSTSNWMYSVLFSS